ncbi:MAG: hypothetical protein CMM07_29690 [Rhodopirellula sp.]|nr:hypothetical protein [Rhodopirellula sp.]
MRQSLQIDWVAKKLLTKPGNALIHCWVFPRHRESPFAGSTPEQDSLTHNGAMIWSECIMTSPREDYAIVSERLGIGKAAAFWRLRCSHRKIAKRFNRSSMSKGTIRSSACQS